MVAPPLQAASTMGKKRSGGTVVLSVIKYRVVSSLTMRRKVEKPRKIVIFMIFLPIGVAKNIYFGLESLAYER